MSLASVYNPENKYEIGIDEAGRGPLFGRLYVAAVILPEGGFNNPGIKDSKKIKSKKKMADLSEFIKKESKAWAIHYIDHDIVDKINIRRAVFQGMHECIKQCLLKCNGGIDVFTEKTFLLIDGNDFIPFSVFKDDRLYTIPYETVEGGDNRFQAIAAASILAKCARDQYIEELCQKYPELSKRYNMDKNMGYGTKAHLDGILEHGITQWHRATYGRCKEARLNPLL